MAQPAFNVDDFIAETVGQPTAPPATPAAPAAAPAFDVDQFINETVPKEEGFGQKVLGAVAKAGEVYDSYGAAPLRAFIFEMVPEDSAKPAKEYKPGTKISDEELRRTTGMGGNLGRAVEAAYDAFGEKSKVGGEDIAKKQGVDESQSIVWKIPGLGVEVATPEGTKTLYPTSSKAELTGLAYDVLADPFNVVPLGAVAKGLTGGVKATGKGAINLAKATAKKTADVSRYVLASSERGQKLARGLDIAKSGTVAAKDAAVAMARGLADLFNPSVSPDFAKFKEIADANQIPTELLSESIEFGPNSAISKLGRFEKEGLLAQQAADRFNDGLNRITQATDTRISDIGLGTVLKPEEAGSVIQSAFERADDVPRTISAAVDDKVAQIGGGEVLDPVAAGQLIKDAYDDQVKEFFKGIDATYKRVAQRGGEIDPGELIQVQSQLGDMWRTAERTVELATDSVQESQAKQMFQAIKAALAAGTDFDKFTQVLRNVGETAYRKNFYQQIPPDIKKMRSLYETMRSAVYRTVEKTDPRLAQELKDSNQAMHEFFGEKSVLSKVLGAADQKAALAPERIFQNLVLSGDTQKIAALRNILPPEAMQRVKGAFLGSVLRRDPTTTLNFSAAQNALKSKAPLANALFDSEELRQVQDLIGAGASHKSMGGYSNVIAGRDSNPEGVFRFFISNGNSSRAQMLRQVLSPEELQVVKAAALDNLIERTLNRPVPVSFDQVASKARQQEIVLRTLLDPEELKGFADVISLGKNYGPMVVSSSGTGASNNIRAILGGSSDQLTNKSLLATLKARARQAGVIPPDLPKPPVEAPAASLLPKAKPRTSILPRRGKLEKAAKGAQIYSTTTRDDEDR